MSEEEKKINWHIEFIDQNKKETQDEIIEVFERTLMYLNTIDFDRLPEKYKLKTDELIKRIHDDSDIEWYL